MKHTIRKRATRFNCLAHHWNKVLTLARSRRHAMRMWNPEGKIAAVVITVLVVSVSTACDNGTVTSEPVAIAGNSSGPGHQSSGMVIESLPSSPATSLRRIDPTSATIVSGQSGIWVNGQSTISVEPDIALLSIGIEAREVSVTAARNIAATAMSQVVQAMKARGITDDNIGTTRFSIYPQTVFADISDKFGKRHEPRIIGYIVSNNLQVKIHSLDDVGGVIDSAADAGGDLVRIDSIQFTVDDPNRFAVQMRRAAAADALAKAQLYAASMGVTLGPITFLSEVDSPSQVIGGMLPMMRSTMELADSPRTPVNVADVSLSTQIQAAFTILTP